MYMSLLFLNLQLYWTIGFGEEISEKFLSIFFYVKIRPSIVAPLTSGDMDLSKLEYTPHERLPYNFKIFLAKLFFRRFIQVFFFCINAYVKN